MSAIETPPAERPYRNWLAWLVLVAGALLALVAARGADAQEVTYTAEEVTRGEQIYQAQCAQCHGADGGGGETNQGRPVPALVGREEVTAAYVDLTMRVGRMPPPADPYDNRPRQVVLDDEERHAVVAYTVEVFGLDPTIPDVGEGDVAEGLRVFGLHCAHCHGNTGAGGVAGAGAWTPQVNDVDGVAIVEAIRVGPFEMPAFSTEAITPQEADSVVAFLHQVEADEGTPLFGLVELNPVIASAFVALLALATVFSTMFIAGRPAMFPDASNASTAATGDAGAADVAGDGAAAPEGHDPTAEDGTTT